MVRHCLTDTGHPSRHTAPAPERPAMLPGIVSVTDWYSQEKVQSHPLGFQGVAFHVGPGNNLALIAMHTQASVDRGPECRLYQCALHLYQIGPLPISAPSVFYDHTSFLVLQLLQVHVGGLVDWRY